MKGMHFIVIEEGAVAGTGVIKQGIGQEKFLCEYPQQTGLRLSRIVHADKMVDWLFFGNANSLSAYMQSQMPPKPNDPPATGDGTPNDPPEGSDDGSEGGDDGDGKSTEEDPLNEE